jgi:hypothetical protein
LREITVEGYSRAMTDQQELIVLTMIFKPIGLTILFLLVLRPIRLLVERRLKDGKLKRLLLYRLNS